MAARATLMSNPQREDVDTKENLAEFSVSQQRIAAMIRSAATSPRAYGELTAAGAKPGQIPLRIMRPDAPSDAHPVEPPVPPVETATPVGKTGEPVLTTTVPPVNPPDTPLDPGETPPQGEGSQKTPLGATVAPVTATLPVNTGEDRFTPSQWSNIAPLRARGNTIW